MRSRVNPPSWIVTDSCFILHILSTQDDNFGTNPRCWTDLWHRHPAVIPWGKQSKGGCSCIWGILFLFICPYVSSQISLWFAVVLAEALQRLRCRCAARSVSAIRFQQLPVSGCCKITREDHIWQWGYSPPPPTLKPLASFEQTRFWIGGGRGAFKSPKLWLAAPSACPSYWHLVLLYQLLIKQCSRTASVKISMQRETGVCLPAVASRFWNKSRMLAFHY